MRILLNKSTFYRKWTLLLLGFTWFWVFTGCDLLGGEDDDNTSGSSPSSPSDQTNEGWLIPVDEVLDGGPGPDGIPSVDNPDFLPVNQTGYVDENRLVVGIKIGDDIRAYPHQILDWHEIVNDHVGGKSIALTYCPLTGTAIGWDRRAKGEVTEIEFGVSGLLFRNNLVPFDRNSGSRWSQMQMRSVEGDLAGQNIRTVKVIETTWKTWKELYPNSDVLTTNTGFGRPYQRFAYGQDYLINHDRILFPVKNRDNRLNNKVRVHGIIASEVADEFATVRVYPIGEFGTGVTVVRDHINGKEFVIAGSADLNFASAFEATLQDGSRPEFEPVQDELPVILKDEEGNRWDIFGYALEGPRKGEQLIPAKSYTGYWFAWADFFPNRLEIYNFQ